ncbi:DUF4365 domain-containing protein [Kutzneria viridogrisea]|uniref:DUF4365 domain-containing protein n=1 Tax=Kutzneria viridogrisea TaxID=47990 RepID=A0ABR6BIX8_9PSEU|nr:hypothetical protein [Kutzneria viridogrisea]
MASPAAEDGTAAGQAEPPDGQLPGNARREQFSLAFVRLVAAAAGCSIKSHETDYDGVDITITSSADYSKFYCPELELQVKCTTQHRLLTSTHMSWPMEAKPFRKLTNPKRYNEAFLGVLLVPADPASWLEQDEDTLLTRSRMYWHRAAELGEIPEDQGTRTVHLPRSNLFTVPQLLTIMQTIGEGGDW